MMAAGLVYLPILISLAMGWGVIFKKRIEQAIPPAFFLLVLLIYPFGLFGRLQWGVWVVLAVCIFSVGYVVFSYVRVADKKSLTTRLVTPGLFVFLFFFVLALWGSCGREYATHSDFSHYGVFLRHMLQFNGYANVPGTLIHYGDYPPASSIPGYFICYLTETYSEGLCLFASTLFCLCIMLPVFRCFSKHNFVAIILMCFVAILLPVIFFPEWAYVSLLVDTPSALLLGYLLYGYFSKHEMDIGNLCNLALTTMMLVLTKTSGGGMAALGVIIIIIDLLVTYEKKRRKRMPDKTRCLTWVLVLLLSLFISYGSWARMVKTAHVNIPFSTGQFSFNALINVLLFRGDQERLATFKRYIDAIFTLELQNHIINLSAFCWIIVVFVCSILLFRAHREDKESRHHYLVLAIGILAGSLIYTLVEMQLYLFTLSSGEAQILSSFQRYYGIWILACLMTVVFLGVEHFYLGITNTTRNSTKSVGIILALLLLVGNPRPILDITLLAPYDIAETKAWRDSFRIPQKTVEYLRTIDSLRLANSNDNQPGRVFCMTFDANIHPANLPKYLRLEAAPINFSYVLKDALDAYVRLDGTEENETASPTVYVSIGELQQLLYKQYTYVYINDFDEVFRKQFGVLFVDDALNEKSLYRVIEVDGFIKLEYIM